MILSHASRLNSKRAVLKHQRLVSAALGPLLKVLVPSGKRYNNIISFSPLCLHPAGEKQNPEQRVNLGAPSARQARSRTIEQLQWCAGDHHRLMTKQLPNPSQARFSILFPLQPSSGPGKGSGPNSCGPQVLLRRAGARREPGPPVDHGAPSAAGTAHSDRPVVRLGTRVPE